MAREERDIAPTEISQTRLGDPFAIRRVNGSAAVTMVSMTDTGEH